MGGELSHRPFSRCRTGWHGEWLWASVCSRNLPSDENSTSQFSTSHRWWSSALPGRETVAAGGAVLRRVEGLAPGLGAALASAAVSLLTGMVFLALPLPGSSGGVKCKQ